MTLPNGNRAMATSQLIKALQGRVIVIQERLEPIWGSNSALSMTLSATTGFVVLILGFAFHWQATRAREGDFINDAVRARIDTALNRGRCGLWDWDLSAVVSSGRTRCSRCSGSRPAATSLRSARSPRW